MKKRALIVLALGALVALFVVALAPKASTDPMPCGPTYGTECQP